MGIANSVLEAVRTEMQRHPGTLPRKVGMRIGEMAAVDQESLRFCFDALNRDTAFESLQLEVEICPRRHRCLQCGRVLVVRDYDFRCPECASLDTKCIGGDELELLYLEVEDHGENTVGAKSTE